MNKKYFFRNRPFWKSEKVRWAGTIIAVVLLISVFTVQNQELWQNSSLPEPDNVIVGETGEDEAPPADIVIVPEPPGSDTDDNTVSGTDNATVTVQTGNEAEVDIDTEAAEVSAPPSSWLAPSSGVYGRGFGYSYDATYEDYRFHSGVDMSLDMGDLVLAVADGKVKAVASDSIWGGRVEIEHDGGLISVYLGIIPSGIKEGQDIQAGETVGTVAPAPAAELAEGTHLHFELLLDGEYVDPLKYLR